MSAHAPFPELTALVDKARACIAAFDDACVLTDSVVAERDGREITDSDWLNHEQTSNARAASVGDLLNHRPNSVAELAVKAHAICSGSIAAEVWSDADWSAVYLADAQHLAALAGSAQ